MVWNLKHLSREAGNTMQVSSSGRGQTSARRNYSLCRFSSGAPAFLALELILHASFRSCLLSITQGPTLPVTPVEMYLLFALLYQPMCVIESLDLPYSAFLNASYTLVCAVFSCLMFKFLVSTLNLFVLRFPAFLLSGFDLHSINQ